MRSYTNGSSDLMTHALLGMATDGSTFFVLPRTFGAAKVPDKFGLRIEDDELLTYGMVSVGIFSVHSQINHCHSV